MTFPVAYCLGLLGLLLGFSTPTLAAAEDYAWTASLAEADQELRRVALGVEVIKGVARPDLADVQVLDAAGKAMPAWLRKTALQQHDASQLLNFHRFSAYSKLHSKTLTAIEERQTPGTHSRLKSTETVRVPQTRIDYIVELNERQLGLNIRSLRLRWSAAEPERLLKLRVEASNSLDDWQLVHEAKTLALSPQGGTARLEWQTVDGLPAGMRHIRLTASEPAADFALQEVQGLYSVTAGETSEWLELAELQAVPGEPRLYRFVIPEGVRAQRLRLHPAGQNELINGRIYASNRGYEKKRTIFAAVQQHNMQAGEHIKPSPSYTLPRQSYSEWWFESDQELQAAPRLSLLYDTYDLFFLAAGQAPYQLYWGNFEADERHDALRSMLKDESLTSSAAAVVASPTMESGGVGRQVPAGQQPWMRWLLYALLAVAVLFTARMALSLCKDMA